MPHCWDKNWRGSLSPLTLHRQNAIQSAWQSIITSMSSAVLPGVVSFETARRTVEEHAAKVFEAHRNNGTTELVELLAASGRVLAEPITADRDQPPFNRATRDGYAIRAEDLTAIPTQLEIAGEVKAGEPGSFSLGKSQAISIMTGAPLPFDANAVVMVEHTKIVGGRVEILRGLSAGENFVPRGAEARAGKVLLQPGLRFDHSSIAIASSVGKKQVRAYRKPCVAVLSTGDELVDVGAAPSPTQIRNSNSYSLSVQIENAGAKAIRLAIAPDEPNRLRELIAEGLQCDLLLITGGISMGKYDLVEQALAEFDAQFFFTGAEIQPGRPVVFGSCGEPHKKYFFGLPGNPVSTMVTFELFARPMIEALAGIAQKPLIFLHARLKATIRTKTGLKRFLPAVLSGAFENAEVELAAWQGSGDVAALARANCYVVVPPDREQIEAGEWVPLLML